MRHVSTKVTAVIAGGALAVLTAGSAYAYWSSTGTGTGSATVGEAVAFTVASSAPTGGALSPGGATNTIAFSVTNPGPGQQLLNKVVITVAKADGTAWTSGSCSADDFSLNGGEPGAAATDVSVAGNLAEAAKKTSSVTLQMIDTEKNQDDCQGVTVPLHLAAS